MKPQPRILVMGAGGIGGIVTSTLLEVGAAVTAVSTNPRIRAAVDQLVSRIPVGGTGYILPTYTAMLAIRKLLAQRTSMQEVWR